MGLRLLRAVRAAWRWAFSAVYSDGTTPPVTYTYDTAGRLQTAANGTDTLTWSYDLAGQLLTEQSSKNASTVAYTYDAAGNRLTLGLDGTLFVSYAYDDASRLTGITRGTNVFGFGYDVVNRRTSMTYPNGVNTAYTYDALNNLLNLSATKAPSTTITNFTYTYDATGNRLTKAQTDYTETYAYDDLYRLTGVDRSAGGTGLWRYAYDPVGNRTTAQTDLAVTTSTYNEKNQLLASAGGGQLRVRGMLDEPGTAMVSSQQAQMKAGNIFEATIPATVGTNTFTVQATDTSGNVRTKNYQVDVSGAGVSFGYDTNGNLATKTEDGHAWVYEWNAENHLTRVLKDGTEVARFVYDPLGHRVEKVAAGVTTTWVYDGEDVLRETTSTGVTLKYVQGLGIDEALAVEDGAGAITYNHVDGLGSVVRTTNPAGAVIASRQYDTFGNIQSGATSSGFAFTGRYWDSETGLYHYRARYYDPKAGRFLSQDPIGFWGGANFYAYVRNNPVKWTDPLGLAPQGTQCCAEKEEPEIRKQMQNARARIESLEKTGTAVIPGGSNVPCAATTCSLFRIPGTNMFTSSAETDYQPSCQNLSPCIKKCVDMHEAVHRRMCKRLGMKFLTLSEYQAEYPAYMTELGCYIRTLREGGKNPYPD